MVLDLASFLGFHAVMITLLIGSIELDDGSLTSGVDMNNCVVCQGRVLRNNLPSAGKRHESRVQVQCAKFIFVFAVIETAFRLFSGVAFIGRAHSLEWDFA